MMRRLFNSPAEMAVAGLGAVLLLAIAVNPLIAGITSWTCTPTPKPAHLFAGIELLFSGSVTSWKMQSDTCGIPVLLIQAIAVAFLLVVTGLATWGIYVWWRFRQSDKFYIYEMQRREGLAQRSEVVKGFGQGPVLKRAARLRPSLADPSISDVGLCMGVARNMPVWITIEDSVALLGSPRSGKGLYFLVSWILDYPGPVVTTSTRADNLALTIGARRRLGDVAVFDPQGLSGISQSIRWNPIRGCEDPLRATQRASAIVAGSKLGGSSNNAEWAERASMILARLLHAAAIGGRGVDALALWGANPKLAKEAVNLLRIDGTPGWAEDLDGIINGSPELLSSSWFGVSGATAPLMIPTVRDAMSPTGDDEFDVERFLEGRNTLYLIGTGAGAGAAGGFLGALMDDITEFARKKALRSAGSRIDPPLGLILDEIANIFTWPALPQLMADGGGAGIQPIVVLQALSQAETVWSRAEALTIWNAATAKAVLGGAGDTDFLADFVKLIGHRDVRKTSQSWSDSGGSTSTSQSREEIMTVDELRRMPESISMLLSRTRRGVFLQSNRWTDRPDASEIHASRREVEAEQRGAHIV